MTKKLRKAIILRSQLKRKFINNKFEENSKNTNSKETILQKVYVKRRWNIFKTWMLLRSMIPKCFGKV